MDMSPIVSSMGYLLNDPKKLHQGTSEQKVNEFQRIMIQEVFAKSFVPDEPLGYLYDDDNEDEGLFNRAQMGLQTQLMRQVLTGRLVEMDALGLRRKFRSVLG